MRIAALQSDIIWEDPPANFERLEPWIRAAAASGARLVALPEMYACGFSMAAERIGEPVEGPSTRFLCEQARRHGLWLAGSVPERPDGCDRPFNTLVVAGPGGETHRYRKIHPFTYADEHRHYRAGEEFVTVVIEGLRFTLFVCYDLRFADEFWATAPATDVYLVVANWPEPRRHHWRTLLEARAIENLAYVVGVNRVGVGGGLRYRGDSRIVDPRGEILASAAEQETLLLAELDPNVVQATREAFPFLDDRR
ncbi:MAG: carbon-nitrogen family hydrolase [bacterium]|nr:carbon-nitrogen family hydrolase [bacterium]